MGFLPNYDGSGPERDLPRKTGIFRLWEMLSRDFWDLFRAGFLALLGCVPFLLGTVFSLSAHVLIYAPVAGLLGGAVAGPELCGLADTVLRGLRDEPGFWWHTYKKAWARNAKSCLLPGTIGGALLSTEAFFLFHAGALGLNTITGAALIAGILLVLALSLYLWPQLALMELSFPRLVKNSALPEDLRNWTWNVSWWSDPVLLGRYPEEGLERFAPYLPKITDEDMKLIAEPIDVYAQNLYNGKRVRMGEDGRPEIVPRRPGFPRTANGWPITPECLYWGPKFLYERYGKPLYITENGMSCHDTVSLDGKVHDPNRIDFLARYLQQLRRAAGEIDLRGYFQWSLMDNFEWEKGYSERFGLIYVDYRTQKRILKDSADWYRETILTNGSLVGQ